MGIVPYLRKKDSVIIWSVQKFELAEDCLRRYFYRYGPPHIPKPQTGPMAYGRFLHKKTEHFFKEDEDFIPREGLEKFYAPTAVPKNKSPESFTATCCNNWRFMFMQDLCARKKIQWSWGEAYAYLHELEIFAPVLYERTLTQGNPAFAELAFSNIPLRHKNHYHYFLGRIDDVRRCGDQLTVRDHKTGRDHPTDYTLYHDLQFTVYGLALLHLLGTNQRLAERLGMRPTDAASWVGHEAEFLPLLTMERHEVRTGELRQTTRTPLHAHELFEKLDGLEAQIERHSYPAERNDVRCNRCYVYKQCAEDFAQGGKSYPLQRKLFFEHQLETSQPALEIPREKARIVQHRLKFG